MFHEQDSGIQMPSVSLSTNIVVNGPLKSPTVFMTEESLVSSSSQILFWHKSKLFIIIKDIKSVSVMSILTWRFYKRSYLCSVPSWKCLKTKHQRHCGSLYSGGKKVSLVPYHGDIRGLSSSHSSTLHLCSLGPSFPRRSKQSPAYSHQTRYSWFQFIVTLTTGFSDKPQGSLCAKRKEGQEKKNIKK